MDTVYRKVYSVEKFFRTLTTPVQKYNVTFKPLVISFDTMGFQSVFLRFKRGSYQTDGKKLVVQRFDSKKISSNTLEFNEKFSKICKFYEQKKVGQYWSKIAEIQVVRFNGYKEEVLCQMNLDLSFYIGKNNHVRNRCNLSGGVHYLDFEVSATPAVEEEFPNECCARFRTHWHPENRIRKHYVKDDDDEAEVAPRVVSQQFAYIQKMEEPGRMQFSQPLMAQSNGIQSRNDSVFTDSSMRGQVM